MEGLTNEEVIQYASELKRQKHEIFEDDLWFKEWYRMLMGIAGPFKKTKNRLSESGKKRWNAMLVLLPRKRSRSLPSEYRFRGYKNLGRASKAAVRIPPSQGTIYMQHSEENYKWLLDKSGHNRRQHPFVTDFRLRRENPTPQDLDKKPFDPVVCCGFCTKREYKQKESPHDRLIFEDECFADDEDDDDEDFFKAPPMNRFLSQPELVPRCVERSTSKGDLPALKKTS